MSSPTRILFLGIDAGDKYLIQKWASDQTLKTLGSLLAKGLVGATVSLEGFFEGSTWPSFYTGLTPARHGFHRVVQLKPGTYEFYRCYTGDFVKREPFWNHLSRSGRRVAILDIPLSGISKIIGGIQVVEWGSHDAVYGFSTSPAKLKGKISRQFGLHPLRNPCDSFGRSPQDFCALRDLLVQGVRKKAELTKYYLNKGCWDFFAQVFTESHCIGHQCWHLHDLSHPGYDPEIVAITGDPIRDVYIAIDAAIGEILAHVDSDTIVIFLASHRMSHNFGAQFLLPEILTRLKVSEATAAEITPGKPLDAIEKLDSFLTWCWEHTPKKITTKLKPIRNYIRAWLEIRQVLIPSSMRGIDIKTSRCFPLDNGLSVGGIRLNLVGREPNGVLKAGAECEAFCEALAEDLLKIIDCDTGEPVIKSVKRTAELYRGEYLHHLPDLLVEWSDEKPLGNEIMKKHGASKLRLTSDKLGVVEGVNTYCRTGDHRPEGLFIAFGPGIEGGHLERAVSIMDFAPTFASLLDVTLPDVDGKPISEIVTAFHQLKLRSSRPEK